MDNLRNNNFLTTKDASKYSGYSADYLARLARSGEVKGEHLGRTWFIDRTSLDVYLRAQEALREERALRLARARVIEYRSHQTTLANQQRTSPTSTTASPVQPRPGKELQVSPLRPTAIMTPSFISQVGALAIALLVVWSASRLAATPLLPMLASKAVAVAGQVSEAATAHIEPIKTAVRSHLALSQEALLRAGKLSTQMIQTATVPSNFKPPTTLLTRTTNQAVLSSKTNAISPTQISPRLSRYSLPAGLYASLATARRLGAVVVGATHALIDTDVALAYVAPTVAPEAAQMLSITIGKIGMMTESGVARMASVIRETSTPAIHYVGGQAYVAVIGASNAMDMLDFGVQPVKQIGVLASADASGVGGAIGRHLAKVLAFGGSAVSRSLSLAHKIKNSLQNIVRTARVEAVRQRPSNKQLAVVAASTPKVASAPAIAASSPVTERVSSQNSVPDVVVLPVSATTLSYGDIIDYDEKTGLYTASKVINDPAVFGVVVENPPLELVRKAPGVPIARSGAVLVNVTAENGPIRPGDTIVASSLAGKGMRGIPGAENAIGVAQEAFTGEGVAKGAAAALGTIIVAVDRTGAGIPSAKSACSASPIFCALAQKVNATPIVALLRYLVAAAVALGSLYLAFRAFVADAVNGVISVGRNPRAKAAIQTMVVFNGVLAILIAFGGLAVGLMILLIQI